MADHLQFIQPTSAEAAGLGDWAPAYQAAKLIVANMTNDEKNEVTYGFRTTESGCNGISHPISRLNFTGLCLQDSGSGGIRTSELANSYPSSIHIGATWNREISYQRGAFMGAEFKRKGANVVLGPSVGGLGRSPKGGRNWESMSNDPYLLGSLTADMISGLQRSVIASVKHLVGAEQETNRKIPRYNTGYNQSVSANIDDKTMHELYLWPFQDAVKAGAGSIMCAYNRVNNSYACQNSKLMNGLLKEELAFQGFVVSDWYEQRSGIGSANAGLDLAMPNSTFWQNGNLTAMVKNGTVAQSRLDDMATRIIAAWYKYGAYPEIGHGLPPSLVAAHKPVDARDPASKSHIFQSAVEGHVLLKNEAGALPLRKPKLLSVFGYDAIAQKINGPEAGGYPLFGLGLSGTRQYLNGTELDQTEISWIIGSSVSGEYSPEAALNGTLITGSGSGSSMPGYIDAPLDAIHRHAYEDGTYVTYDVSSPDPLVNQGSDACLVFINAQSGEGLDRRSLSDSYSDALVQNVASKCANTIVVIHAVWARLVDDWIDHPNVTAVMYASLPGQDTGRALIEVLYGEQSPSGRLPYTIAKQETDYGQSLEVALPSDETPYYPQANYTEGVYIDYKHFIAHNITPRYEFGFGLTYTTFEYRDLEVVIARNVDLSYQPKSKQVIEGGLEALWHVVAHVECTVENVGGVEAAEVAQLYVGIPGGPARVLRGYEKHLLAPGQKRRFRFELARRDLSTWDVEKQAWGLQKGTYGIYIGKSVLDIQLVGRIRI